MSCDSMNKWSKSSTVTSILSLRMSATVLPSKNLVNVSSSAFSTSTSRGSGTADSQGSGVTLKEGVSTETNRFGVDDAANRGGASDTVYNN